MASEVAIREAIVERIQALTAAFSPAPVVLGRDVAGLIESGAITGLLDSEQRIHVWTVTQTGAVPIDNIEYALIYEVTQWTQYQSGTDAANSDNQASAERDAVIAGFNDPSDLPDIINGAQPISFPQGSISRSEPAFRGQVRVSRGTLRVRNVYGCS